MMASESKETKIPLGKELFASVNVWNGVPLVHIRHFKTLISPFQPHSSLQVATKSGICMNEAQFQKLIVNLPTLVSELDKVKTTPEAVTAPSSSQTIPMKTPVRASQSFNGKNYIHRAPSKPKPLLKRLKLGSSDEPIIKNLKLEEDVEPFVLENTNDMMSRAAQTIHQE